MGHVPKRNRSLLTPSLGKSPILARFALVVSGVVFVVLTRRTSGLECLLAIRHASGRRLQSRLLANSHAQSLDPHPGPVSHLSILFSFPVERSLDVTETHALKSLSNKPRLGSSNRAKSWTQFGKSDDVQARVHARSPGGSLPLPRVNEKP